MRKITKKYTRPGAHKYDIKNGDIIHNWEVLDYRVLHESRYYALCKCICSRTTKLVRYDVLFKGKSKQCQLCGKENSLLPRKGTLAKDGQKQCSTCLEFKDVTYFKTKEKAKDKLCSQCLKCRNNRKNQLIYGIDNEYYDFIFKSQGFQCKICHKTQQDLDNDGGCWFCIDHDHSIDYPHMRGIICSKCNAMLGFALDNIEILKNAIDYLTIGKNLIYSNNRLKCPYTQVANDTIPTRKEKMEKYRIDENTFDAGAYWTDYPEEKPPFKEDLPLNYEI